MSRISAAVATLRSLSAMELSDQMQAIAEDASLLVYVRDVLDALAAAEQRAERLAAEVKQLREMLRTVGNATGWPAKETP